MTNLVVLNYVVASYTKFSTSLRVCSSTSCTYLLNSMFRSGLVDMLQLFGQTRGISIHGDTSKTDRTMERCRDIEAQICSKVHSLDSDSECSLEMFRESTLLS